jgi:LCP family protein required for cell wall assembly
MNTADQNGKTGSGDGTQAREALGELVMLCEASLLSSSADPTAGTATEPPQEWVAGVVERMCVLVRETTDEPGTGADAGPADLVLDLDDLPQEQTPDGRPDRCRPGGRTGLSRQLAWTVLSALLPGSGLVAAGRKVLGGTVIAVAVSVAVAVAALVAVFLRKPSVLIVEALVHPWLVDLLGGLGVLLILGWAAHLVATSLSLRGTTALTRVQNAVSWGLVAVLAAGGIGAGMWGVTRVRSAEAAMTATITTVATGPEPSGRRLPRIGTSGNPWSPLPRMNVLFIGSDAGPNRLGTRPDSLIVASIDPRTADTVLIDLARTMTHVPFPEGTEQARDYPHGYTCPDDACRLSDLWKFGEDHRREYYPKEKDPGLRATVDGVEQTLGLRVNDYVLMDLKGFPRFVDAVGGVTIDITRPVPVGGHKDPATGREIGVTGYLAPGERRLNGYEALWYARSRSGDSSDSPRTARQRQIVTALIQQADPTALARKLPDVLRSSRDAIRTSISPREVESWARLARRIQKASIGSLSIPDDALAPGHSDVAALHERVRRALATDHP